MTDDNNQHEPIQQTTASAWMSNMLLMTLRPSDLIFDKTLDIPSTCFKVRMRMSLFYAFLTLSFVICGADEATSNTQRTFSRQTRYLTELGTPVPFDSTLAGYEPATLVTDQSLIDVDLQMISRALSFNAFSDAERLYQRGGHSLSVATVLLEEPFPRSYIARTVVLGITTQGEIIRGSLLSDVSAGSFFVEFLYPVSAEPGLPKCQVGGTFLPVFEGCLQDFGKLIIGGDVDVFYSYNLDENNNSFRSIQGLTTRAEDVFQSCSNCPFPMYQKFVSFYVDFNYADQFVSAAFSGASTGLRSSAVDFSSLSLLARAEAVNGGIVALIFWMYTIGKMEYAISACLQGDTNTVRFWDESVAFYTGSLEGTDGSGKGNLLYDLATKQCRQFGTCGKTGTGTEGTAKVNFYIFDEFEFGKNTLSRGFCSQPAEAKDRIVAMMQIPLVQGFLHFAYILEKGATEAEAAAGASFAAAVLPLVHGCSDVDASIISENLGNIGNSKPTNFGVVKLALERNYECLSITCEDVGGLVKADGDGYLEGAAPCITGATKSPTASPTITQLPTVSAEGTKSPSGSAPLFLLQRASVIVPLLSCLFFL